MNICLFEMRAQLAFLASPTALPLPHYTFLQNWTTLHYHNSTHTKVQTSPILTLLKLSSLGFCITTFFGSLTTSLIVPLPSCSHSQFLHKMLKFPKFLCSAFSLSPPICLHCWFPGSTSHHLWPEFLWKPPPWYLCLQSILSRTYTHHYPVRYICLCMPKTLMMVDTHNTLVGFMCCFLCLECTFSLVFLIANQYSSIMLQMALPL